MILSKFSFCVHFIANFSSNPKNLNCITKNVIINVDSEFVGVQRFEKRYLSLVRELF